LSEVGLCRRPVRAASLVEVTLTATSRPAGSTLRAGEFPRSRPEVASDSVAIGLAVTRRRLTLTSSYCGRIRARRRSSAPEASSSDESKLPAAHQKHPLITSSEGSAKPPTFAQAVTLRAVPFLIAVCEEYQHYVSRRLITGPKDRDFSHFLARNTPRPYSRCVRAGPLDLGYKIGAVKIGCRVSYRAVRQEEK
jgi:hypothetical protein